MEDEPRNIIFTNKLQLASCGVSRVNVSVNAFRFSFPIQYLTAIGVDYDNGRMIISTLQPQEDPMHHVFSLPDCDISYEFFKTARAIQKAERLIKKSRLLSEAQIPIKGSRYNQPRTLKNALVFSNGKYLQFPKIFFTGSDIRLPGQNTRSLKPNEHVILRFIFSPNKVEQMSGDVAQNGGGSNPQTEKLVVKEWGKPSLPETNITTPPNPN